MSVIAFPNLAPQGPEASMSWELRSLTAINRSPLNAVVTTLERPGAHWAVRMPYQNLAADRRARLQSFVSSARGHAQRFYVPVYGWTRRGSFPATELLTNNTFASGTTGWSAGSGATLTASDGVLRITRIISTAGASYASQSLSGAVQYAPYCGRVLVSGFVAGEENFGVSLSDGVNAPSSTGDSAALYSVVIPTFSTTPSFFIDQPTEVGLAGVFRDVSYISFARCALVDNGPNAATFSDAIDDAAWSKTGATAGANLHTAPDGVSPADRLTEDGSTGFHYLSRTLTRSSVAEDWVVWGVFARNTGSRDIRLIVGSDGSNYASCDFNLSAATAGTPVVTGSATHPRAHVRDLRDGYRLCYLTARLAASTSVVIHYEMLSGGSASYTGDGSASLIVWHLGAAQSSFPVRATGTTSSASTGTAQTGSALHLRGLPASTNGLLLKGDPAEIITGSTSQLVRTRAPLDSDAAGLGYWEFEPPLRISPSDNAAVIIENPMCRMMMENNVNGWTDRLGGFSDLEFAAMEDTYP